MASVDPQPQRKRPFSGSAIGTVAALGLLFGTGAVYRAAASWFERSGGAVQLNAGALDAFPLLIGQWAGLDLPLDELIIKRTDTDAHLNRRYHRYGGRESVTLFMGSGVRIRDLMPHRPEVCYIGAGWTLDESRRIELTVTDGSVLPCQTHTFYRGGLDAQRVAVLNYYIVDDVYCADVSLLRSKAWRFKGKTAYVAQVQIAGRIDRLSGSAGEAIRAFAVESAVPLRALLRDAVAQVVLADSEKVP